MGSLVGGLFGEKLAREQTRALANRAGGGGHRDGRAGDRIDVLSRGALIDGRYCPPEVSAPLTPT